ncbi:MAG TPA: QueT transporter family protein, partial [Metalysinibacillus sp.]
MKIKLLAVNATVAALYVALALAVKPIAFGELQFRIPEIFNHLIAFNPLFMPGVILGVFISNLGSELGPIDLAFGVGHSVITLGLAIIIFKFVP